MKFFYPEGHECCERLCAFVGSQERACTVDSCRNVPFFD